MIRMSIKLPKNPRGRGKDQRDSLGKEQYVTVPWVQKKKKKELQRSPERGEAVTPRMVQKGKKYL